MPHCRFAMSRGILTSFSPAGILDPRCDVTKSMNLRFLFFLVSLLSLVVKV